MQRMRIVGLYTQRTPTSVITLVVVVIIAIRYRAALLQCALHFASRGVEGHYYDAEAVLYQQRRVDLTLGAWSHAGKPHHDKRKSCQPSAFHVELALLSQLPANRQHHHPQPTSVKQPTGTFADDGTAGKAHAHPPIS
ncbi:hypothetical protein AA0116_g12816 [Alternaria tenuissima]|nr:hypothetical protein AA0116_g12816 [Alternaria tenuissima]